MPNSSRGPDTCGGRVKRGLTTPDAQEGKGLKHYFLENYRTLISSLMGRVDAAERVHREEHAV